MGSHDIPPPHVTPYLLPVSNLLLQAGACLWTICYILIVRQSIRTRSYGMPLFALALNFSWEAVFAIYVADSSLEKLMFTIWLVIDCGMVYSMVKYGKYEWAHSPVVANNIGTIFIVLTIHSSLGIFAFAKWWLDNEIGKRDGKIYRGVPGPDTTELVFWTAAFAQAYLSVASLAQLLVRQNSGGVSWGVWVTRTLGSVVGFNCNYVWLWYFWREAHGYVFSPFGVFLWGTGLICDLIYPFFFHKVKKTERVLEDGRKARREIGVNEKGNKVQ